MFYHTQGTIANLHTRKPCFDASRDSSCTFHLCLKGMCISSGRTPPLTLRGEGEEGDEDETEAYIHFPGVFMALGIKENASRYSHRVTDPTTARGSTRRRPSGGGELHLQVFHWLFFFLLFSFIIQNKHFIKE